MSKPTIFNPTEPLVTDDTFEDLRKALPGVEIHFPIRVKQPNL
jgi:hypothetical protein